MRLLLLLLLSIPTASMAMSCTTCLSFSNRVFIRTLSHHIHCVKSGDVKDYKISFQVSQASRCNRIKAFIESRLTYATSTTTTPVTIGIRHMRHVNSEYTAHQTKATIPSRIIQRSTYPNVLQSSTLPATVLGSTPTFQSSTSTTYTILSFPTQTTARATSTTSKNTAPLSTTIPAITNTIATDPFHFSSITEVSEPIITTTSTIPTITKPSPARENELMTMDRLQCSV